MSVRLRVLVAFGLAAAWMSPVIAQVTTGISALLVCLTLLVLGAAGLSAHFHYLHRRLLADRMLADGWQRLPHWVHKEVWSCPHCGAMLASLANADRHLNPATSFCAAFGALLERQAAEAAAAGQRPPDTVNWAEFVHPGGSGYDSMTADPARELEQ